MTTFFICMTIVIIVCAYAIIWYTGKKKEIATDSREYDKDFSELMRNAEKTIKESRRIYEWNAIEESPARRIRPSKAKKATKVAKKAAKKPAKKAAKSKKKARK